MAAGELSAETRAALGIGAADPPPWLPRMRLLGLPPGWSGNAAARGAAGGEEDFVIFDGEGEAAQVGRSGVSPPPLLSYTQNTPHIMERPGCRVVPWLAQFS